MRKTTLSLMIGALAFSGTALGQQGDEIDFETGSESQLSIGDVRKGDPEDIFIELDANADGVISFDEAQAMNGLPQQWDKFDLDGDDALDMDEFSSLASNSSGIRGRGNNDWDFTRS